MISSVAQVAIAETQLPSSTARWSNRTPIETAQPPPLPARNETPGSTPSDAWRSQDIGQFDPEILCELVNNWDRDFLDLLKDGLEHNDTATIQIWRALGVYCHKISPDQLLNLLTEAMQVPESPAAIHLAVAILQKIVFKDDAQLVTASVKTLLSRNPLELLPYAGALIERGQWYGCFSRRTPGKIFSGKSKALDASHPPEMLDLAGAACIYMLTELPTDPKHSRDPEVSQSIKHLVRSLEAWSPIYAKELAEAFPNSLNPWIPLVAALAPEQLVQWQQQYKRESSRLILPVDVVRGATYGLVTTAICSGALWISGIVQGRFGAGFSLSAGAYQTIMSIFSSRKVRRNLAEAQFPPIHREQVDEKIRQLLTDGKLKRP